MESAWRTAAQALDLQNSTGTTVQSGSIDGNGEAGVLAHNISKTAFVGFFADSNTQGGLIIKHATASAVQSIDASGAGFGMKVSGGGSNVLSIINSNSNGTYGVWLNGSSGNSVNSFTVDGSGLAGVYIGCSTTGPNGTTCASVSLLP